MSYYNKKTSFDVSIDYQLYQSGKGNYFIGQTPILNGETEHSLAILYNPPNSNRNIYVNAITITNISDNNLSSEFYLRSSSNKGKISNLVSCANTSIYPEPNHKGQIKYLNPTSNPPYDGVPIFSRIVSPNSTLVVDGGQIILGPNQSLSVYIGGFSPVIIDKIIFAFGWWEEVITKNCDC
ncbi:DUF6143 family protein [Clostridium sp. D53t1_180928_C8]|uniref:DUF6143 family protein n=1 Tax=Clostridium sp. D53t1_180928_C8 TaxID=2787101 RepID=UPI0018AA2993|nr:DUF6143 family protein [Clostridium sp. D53t1_180928_C8]